MQKCPCLVVTHINVLHDDLYSYYAFHPIINDNDKYFMNYCFFMSSDISFLMVN